MHAAATRRPAHATCGAAALPRIGLQQWLERCRRTVVVAPHPDDETLGAGGLMATLLCCRAPLMVVLVTDGEASHPAHGASGREMLRRARPLECMLALRSLGWERPHIRRLQLPDGALASHEDALTARLARFLQPDDRVLTTWQHDGHPDHEATARAVAHASRETRCNWAQFPVWARARVLQGGEDTHEAGRVCRFDIDAAALRRKRLALAAYRSQQIGEPIAGTPPILAPDMVASFLAGFEVLLL